MVRARALTGRKPGKHGPSPARRAHAFLHWRIAPNAKRYFKAFVVKLTFFVPSSTVVLFCFPLHHVAQSQPSPHSEEAVEGSVGRVQPTQVSAHDVGTSMGSASSADHPLWLPPPHAVDLAGISFPPRFVFKCGDSCGSRALLLC